MVVEVFALFDALVKHPPILDWSDKIRNQFKLKDNTILTIGEYVVSDG